ncbi:hypothetical protein SLA2020_268450 [Shorea laevis]
MDLGTVKSRLNKNWYKSPKEFAEDVRLTFSNAMTYNPKGQDVHVMAEQLLKVFEDRWTIIESDYHRELRYGMDFGVGLPTPTSRKAPPLLPPPLDMRRILDSKHKRKAELAIQARAEAQQNVQDMIQTPVVAEVAKEDKADERNVSSLSPVQGEKQVDNGSRSSSSSSSSSDSGSSSSDSDSETSSASGSDAGSPRN